nr:OSJNBa0028I23.9 [Oryza sativa Japonica Group]
MAATDGSGARAVAADGDGTRAAAAVDEDGARWWRRMGAEPERRRWMAAAAAMEGAEPERPAADVSDGWEQNPSGGGGWRHRGSGWGWSPSSGGGGGGDPNPSKQVMTLIIDSVCCVASGRLYGYACCN